jgi:hypothetical protein
MTSMHQTTLHTLTVSGADALIGLVVLLVLSAIAVASTLFTQRRR